MGNIINPYRYSATGLKTNLVSCWEFDESSGDLLDKHGSNDGTVTGCTRQQTEKPSGLNYSYRFNGSSDKIELGAGSFGSGFTKLTAAIWVKNYSTDDYSCFFFGKYDFTNDQRSFALRGTVASSHQRPRISMGEDGTSTTNKDIWRSGDPAIGTGWRLYVLVFDGTARTGDGTLQGWLNNSNYSSDVDQSTLDDAGYIYDDATEPIYIGATTGSTDWFNGYIAQAAYWQDALSSDLLSTLYSSGSGLAYASW